MYYDIIVLISENDMLQKIGVSLDADNRDMLKQIGHDILSFDKQIGLKRSQTFDHSYAALNSPSLKLSLSIQHFDKQKTLKKTSTFDKSSSLLRSLEHSSSIHHFNTESLKHVDPVDKSSPMHIYSLVRSYSAYYDDLDIPDENVSRTEANSTETNEINKSVDIEEDVDVNKSEKLEHEKNHIDEMLDVNKIINDVTNTCEGINDGSFTQISPEEPAAVKINVVDSVSDDKTESNNTDVENEYDSSLVVKTTLEDLEEFHDVPVQSIKDKTILDCTQCAIEEEKDTDGDRLLADPVIEN